MNKHVIEVKLLFSFFRNKNKCTHKKLSPISSGSFCPDCGMEVEISWLILRCGCCNSKRHSRVAFNSIIPEDKFCTKCGCSEVYIEKKERIEFFDVEYAVISKKEVNNSIDSREILQIWIEKEDQVSEVFNNLRLIPLLIKN